MIISLFIASIGFNSCDSELNLNPQNQFASETFWTNETNALLALAGVYKGSIVYGATLTAPSDWWQYYGLIMLEFCSDNAYDRRGENSNFNLISNGQLLANNSYIRLYWQGSYKRIAICNNFLENVGNVEMSEVKINRMKAEARFIRACQYFYLSQYWGSVPLVNNTLTPEEANIVIKAPKSEVVDFVINELSACVSDLPRFNELPEEESGRASKQAALSFLGRIYLAEKRYSDAIDVYKEIIDYGDNIIDPDYSSIFLEKNENSSENIFSTKYLAGSASNSFMQYSYPAIMRGFHLVCPLGSLAEEYEFTDGTPFSYSDQRYNPDDLSDNRDPRFKYTFLWNGCDFHGKQYITHPDSLNSPDMISYSKQATRTGYGCRKYSDESFSGILKTDWGGDVPIIRYAEVLLSYLEAKLEAGDPISQELLNQTINKVRSRPSVNMPPVTTIDRDLLRQILRRERRVELAMEGIRYWDLLRWGIAGDVLNGDFWGAPYPDSKRYSTLSKKIDPTGRKRWYVTSKNFRKGQDEIWPIPERETNINPNLLVN